jgi:hypothetical protein
VVRSEEARQKELQQIEAYRDLCDLVNTKVGHLPHRLNTHLIRCYMTGSREAIHS